ncbi:maltokinase N-terminal cap-like domain-containing protein [Aeromicrobium piscarium]|uniref:Maltokinase N-terminal cap domain-containing protein n=1 Tax=Aeromicrobium piscarium TaxID=2590901 RepID=A0A554RP27_9ACTN|nr:hypothetical protein [Aeromicrobium piscarium]TSD55801.1 hypothetical protein FNM00_16190 [Aeromicrobium piscarium]
MAIVHPDATLTPSKHELLSAWLPTTSWWPSTEPVPSFAANLRFDDPAGQVGMELQLLPLPVAGRFAVVTLTYRDAPLEGADLIGEMEHTALGHRWVYDGSTDPVFLAEIGAVIAEGRGGSALQLRDGTALDRPATLATGRGSGTGTGDPQIPRFVPADLPDSATGTLEASWDAHPDPVVVAWLTA